MVGEATGNRYHVRAAGRHDAAAAARMFALMAAETADITLRPETLQPTMCRLIAHETVGLLLAETPGPGCGRALPSSHTRMEDETAHGCVADQVVGMCMLVALPDPWTGRFSAEIRALVVDPVHRRQGVGRSLLVAAIGWARNRNCAYLCLVGEPGNRKAQAFYRNVGMKEKSARYFELSL